MKRPQILDTAKQYVTKDRQTTHGAPEDVFQTIADFWSAHLKGRGILTESLTPVDVAAMMAGSKLARITRKPAHEDNWVDLAGYAACGGELATLQLEPVMQADCAAQVPPRWTPSQHQLNQIELWVKELSHLNAKWLDEESQTLLLDAMTRPDSLDLREYQRLSVMHTSFFQS